MMGKRLKKIKTFFVPGRRFKREFRRQARLLINITLGFTIAFTWRQTIFDISESLVNFFIDLKSSALSSVLASVFITIVSVGLIYLASHYLKEERE